MQPIESRARGPMSRMAERIWRQPYLLLVLPTMIWGGNITLGRFVADHISAIPLSQMRWTLALVFLLPLAWPHLARDLPTILRHWKIVILLSITGVSAYNTLVYEGLQTTTALSAALLQSIQPMIIAVFAFAIYRERLTRAQAIGIAVSLAGALTILSRGTIETFAAFAFVPGDLWVLAGVTVYAFYTTILKSRPPIHPVSLLFVMVAVGVVALWPFTIAALMEGARFPLDGLTLATGLYVSLLASVIAYLCFNRGVELIGPNRTSPFFHMIPVFGSLFGILFLAERPEWYHAVGWLLVIAGVAVAQRRARG